MRRQLLGLLTIVSVTGPSAQIGAAERASAHPPASVVPPEQVTGTPWDRYREVLGDKMPTLQRCSALARKRGVFGDVTAHFDWRERRRVRVEVTRSLGAAVKQCALLELEPFAAKAYDLLGKATDFEVSWELGAIEPLFPAGDQFLRAWSKAVAVKGAAAKFARALPPDVKLVDGCLVLQRPARVAFKQSVDLWKNEMAFTAVDGFWTGKLDALAGASDAHVSIVSRPSPHLLVQIEHIDADPRTDPRMGFYPVRRPDPSTNKLCLLPYDERMAAQVTKARDAAGQCWRGDPLESLITPRFSFPAGPTYVRVGSTTIGAACALDTTGSIACCGPTTTTLPGHYRDLDLAGVAVCSVSTAGQAACTDIRNGSRILTLPGTFRGISASTGGACGITESAALVCGWKDPRAVRPPEGAFIAVDAGASCAIASSGELLCWSGGRPEFLGQGRWQSVTSSKTEPSNACAIDAASRPWCWSTTNSATSFAPLSGRAELSKIAMGLGQACGIGKSCGLECWNGSGVFLKEPVCAHDVSVGSPSCVLLESGHLQCWGNDLWAGDTVMKGVR